MHAASDLVISPCQESLMLAKVERIVFLQNFSQALLSKLRLSWIFFQKHLLLVLVVELSVHNQ